MIEKYKCSKCGKKYPRKNGKIKYKGKWCPEGDDKLPWEKKAKSKE